MLHLVRRENVAATQKIVAVKLTWFFRAECHRCGWQAFLYNPYDRSWHTHQLRKCDPGRKLANEAKKPRWFKTIKRER